MKSSPQTTHDHKCVLGEGAPQAATGGQTHSLTIPSRPASETTIVTAGRSSHRYSIITLSAGHPSLGHVICTHIMVPAASRAAAAPAVIKRPQAKLASNKQTKSSAPPHPRVFITPELL